MWSKHWIAAYASPSGEVGTRSFSLDLEMQFPVTTGFWNAATDYVHKQCAGAVLLSLTPTQELFLREGSSPTAVN